MSHLQGHSGSQTQTYASPNINAHGHSHAQGEHGSAHGQTQTYGHTATYAQHSHPQYVLDDRDILTDLLLCSKQLLSAYGTATIECTNPQLRQTLEQIAKTEANFHTQAFEMMQQRGWYETPRSDSNLARQIASLWTQKIQQHEQHPGAQPSYQQSWQQGQQYGDGQQWNQSQHWNSQPAPGQWGLQQTHSQHSQDQWQPQHAAAAQQWDAQQTQQRQGQQAQQAYGQSVFGTPPATGSYAGVAQTTSHDTSSSPR